MQKLGGNSKDALGRLPELMETLRAQCPWDRAQTHESLRRHLLEETYEALDALDHISSIDSRGDGAFDDLCEELGDVLFQVVFHAHLAEEAGRFDLAAVADGVYEKLVARHPVIFDPERLVADADVGTETVAWERNKALAKKRASVMDGIPRTLPALLYASKVLSRAQAVAPEALRSLGGGVAFESEAELGRMLLDLVAAGREAGLDPESALRACAQDLEMQVRETELG